MAQDINIKDMNEKIQIIKKTAEEMQQAADAFPALYRNTARLLASVKMLELNISDIVDIAG